MKIQRRKFERSVDAQPMIQLAREQRSDTLHITDLPYRLSSWALDDPDNVGIWTDEEGRLVGWAAMQTPFWTIDYVFKPNISQSLHRQILAWADARAQSAHSASYGLPAWYVNVFTEQIERRDDLEQAGFINRANAGEEAWSKVWLERSGSDEVTSYPLPSGFSLRPLAGENEVEAYVELHQAVFQTRNMTSEWRKRTLSQPDYIPDLDIVVVASDGRLVAFCIGWLSETTGGKFIGQIEPLGCHADFRRYALGRVALCETLRGLQQHGAESIYVETDSYRNTAFRLYESVGFRVIKDVAVYGKDYNQPAGNDPG